MTSFPPLTPRDIGPIFGRQSASAGATAARRWCRRLLRAGSAHVQRDGGGHWQVSPDAPFGKSTLGELLRGRKSKQERRRWPGWNPTPRSRREKCVRFRVSVGPNVWSRLTAECGNETRLALLLGALSPARLRAFALRTRAIREWLQFDAVVERLRSTSRARLGRKSKVRKATLVRFIRCQWGRRLHLNYRVFWDWLKRFEAGGMLALSEDARGRKPARAVETPQWLRSLFCDAKARGTDRSAFEAARACAAIVGIPCPTMAAFVSIACSEKTGGAAHA